jgi:hypothetical protein
MTRDEKIKQLREARGSVVAIERLVKEYGSRGDFLAIRRQAWVRWNAVVRAFNSKPEETHDAS